MNISNHSLNWPLIRVVPFSEAECPRTKQSGPPLFSWRDFYGLRNAILNILNKYGTVGPEGEMPILETWEQSERAWKSGASNPDFFVVSDMHNSWNRWHRVEASASLVSADLLAELVVLLLSWPEWCIYMALQAGGLTVFRDRILHEGALFESSTSISDLAVRCASTQKTS